MHNHCINKLLNLKGVIVKKIIHADSFVKIMLETAYSARTAHPFRRNGAPFRFKLSKAQQVD